MTTPLALRIAGHPLDEIAAQFGYPDTEAAAAAIRAEIDRTGYAHMPDLHALHMLRLDTLVAVLEPRTDPSDPDPRRAARLLARAQRQRAETLAAFAVSALQRADRGRQTEGRA